MRINSIFNNNFSYLFDQTATTESPPTTPGTPISKLLPLQNIYLFFLQLKRSIFNFYFSYFFEFQTVRTSLPTTMELAAYLTPSFTIFA